MPLPSVLLRQSLRQYHRPRRPRFCRAPEAPAPGRVHGRSRHRPCGGRRPRRRPLSSVTVKALAAGLPPSASATNRYGSSPSTQSRTAKPSSVNAPMGRTLIFLAAEDQRCPVVPENFAPHAKHSHVPVDGGVDVAAVEHHVVDAVDDKCHAYLPARLSVQPSEQLTSVVLDTGRTPDFAARRGGNRTRLNQYEIRDGQPVRGGYRPGHVLLEDAEPVQGILLCIAS